MQPRHVNTRLRRAPIVGLVAIALLTSACGSDDDADAPTTAAAATTTAATVTTVADSTGDTTATTTDDTTADSSTEASTAARTADNAAFPVEIDNKFGTTEIDAQPERVVSIGYTDGDDILAAQRLVRLQGVRQGQHLVPVLPENQLGPVE